MIPVVKTIAVACGLSGHHQCPACNTPAIKLAVFRAMRAVDEERARLSEQRWAAKEATRADRLRGGTMPPVPLMGRAR
jgi:hypothetical protein